MRSSLALAVIAATACAKHSTTGDGPGGDTLAFEVTSADVTLMPSAQVTYCYYFHTSNTTPVAVNRWVSDMAPGSHHAILFMNPGGNQPPDGTISTSSCGGLNSVWTYSTQIPHNELDLPSDDGNGKPLAQLIQPNTAGFLQLHYLNATDQTLTAHIDLKAYALPTNTKYTQTDAFVTYNNDIRIPAGASNVAVTASCPLPAGVKFWVMSTHSHKQSIATQVADGSSVVFSSTDWEHPGSQSWMTAPFYAFASPNLTWQCTYDNNAPPPYCDQGGPASSCSNADAMVVSGQSAVTNEMCMAAGYFFPSTGPRFAVENNGSCVEL
jgi:hypothetical protein